MVYRRRGNVAGGVLRVIQSVSADGRLRYLQCSVRSSDASGMSMGRCRKGSLQMWGTRLEPKEAARLISDVSRARMKELGIALYGVAATAEGARSVADAKAAFATGVTTVTKPAAVTAPATTTGPVAASTPTLTEDSSPGLPKAQAERHAAIRAEQAERTNGTVVDNMMKTSLLLPLYLGGVLETWSLAGRELVDLSPESVWERAPGSVRRRFSRDLFLTALRVMVLMADDNAEPTPC
jgi:hypothetical protein